MPLPLPRPQGPTEPQEPASRPATTEPPASQPAVAPQEQPEGGEEYFQPWEKQYLGLTGTVSEKWAAKQRVKREIAELQAGEPPPAPPPSPEQAEQQHVQQAAEVFESLRQDFWRGGDRSVLRQPKAVIQAIKDFEDLFGDIPGGDNGPSGLEAANLLRNYALEYLQRDLKENPKAKLYEEVGNYGWLPVYRVRREIANRPENQGSFLPDPETGDYFDAPTTWKGVASAERAMRKGEKLKDYEEFDFARAKENLAMNGFLVGAIPAVGSMTEAPEDQRLGTSPTLGHGYRAGRSTFEGLGFLTSPLWRGALKGGGAMSRMLPGGGKAAANRLEAALLGEAAPKATIGEFLRRGVADAVLGLGIGAATVTDEHEKDLMEAFGVSRGQIRWEKARGQAALFGVMGGMGGPVGQWAEKFLGKIGGAAFTGATMGLVAPAITDIGAYKRAIEDPSAENLEALAAEILPNAGLFGLMGALEGISIYRADAKKDAEGARAIMRAKVEILRAFPALPAPQRTQPLLLERPAIRLPGEHHYTTRAEADLILGLTKSALRRAFAPKERGEAEIAVREMLRGERVKKTGGGFLEAAREFARGAMWELRGGGKFGPKGTEARELIDDVVKEVRQRHLKDYLAGRINERDLRRLVQEGVQERRDRGWVREKPSDILPSGIRREALQGASTVVIEREIEATERKIRQIRESGAREARGAVSPEEFQRVEKERGERLQGLITERARLRALLREKQAPKEKPPPAASEPAPAPVQKPAEKPVEEPPAPKPPEEPPPAAAAPPGPGAPPEAPKPVTTPPTPSPTAPKPSAGPGEAVAGPKAGEARAGWGDDPTAPTWFKSWEEAQGAIKEPNAKRKAEGRPPLSVAKAAGDLGYIAVDPEYRPAAPKKPLGEAYPPLTKKPPEKPPPEPPAPPPEEPPPPAPEKPKPVAPPAAPGAGPREEKARAEQKGISARLEETRATEEKNRLEGLWQGLMRASQPDEIDTHVRRLKPGEAAGFLERLRAAPGTNRPVEEALEKVAAPSPPASGPLTFKGFHGTFTPGEEGGKFGGVHVGTEAAARQRVEDIRPSMRGGRPGGEVIQPAEVTLKKPYGSREKPIDETELSTILNLPGRLEALKKQGYDGIVYRNIAEDPGSTSVLAFDRSSVKFGARPEEAPAAAPKTEPERVKEAIRSRLEDVRVNPFVYVFPRKGAKRSVAGKVIGKTPGGNLVVELLDSPRTVTVSPVDATPLKAMAPAEKPYEGAPTIIRDRENREIPARFAVVEERDLKRAFTAGYPPSLYPIRGDIRSRAAARAQLQANLEADPTPMLEPGSSPFAGIPVVWRDTKGEVGEPGSLFIVAGNDSLRALRSLEDLNNTRSWEYRKALPAKAAALGISAFPFKERARMEALTFGPAGPGRAPRLVRIIEGPFEKARELAETRIPKGEEPAKPGLRTIEKPDATTSGKPRRHGRPAEAMEDRPFEPGEKWVEGMRKAVQGIIDDPATTPEAKKEAEKFQKRLEKYPTTEALAKKIEEFVRREGDHPEVTLMYAGIPIPAFVKNVIRGIGKMFFGRESFRRLARYYAKDPAKKLTFLPGARGLWNRTMEAFSEPSQLWGAEYPRIIADEDIRVQRRFHDQRTRLFGSDFFSRVFARVQGRQPIEGILTPLVERDFRGRYKNPLLAALTGAMLDAPATKTTVRQVFDNADPKYHAELDALLGRDLDRYVFDVFRDRYPQHLDRIREARRVYSGYRQNLWEHYHRKEIRWLEREVKADRKHLARLRQPRAIQRVTNRLQNHEAALQRLRDGWKSWGIADYLTHIYEGKGSLAGLWERMSPTLKALEPAHKFNRFIQPRKGKTGYLLDVDRAFAVYIPEVERAVAHDRAIEKIDDYLLGRWYKPRRFLGFDSPTARANDFQIGIHKDGLVYVLDGRNPFLRNPQGKIIGMRVRPGNDVAGQHRQVWGRAEARKAWVRRGGLVERVQGKRRIRAGRELAKEHWLGREMGPIEQFLDKFIATPLGTYLRGTTLSHPRSGGTNMILGMLALAGQVGLSTTFRAYGKAIAGALRLLPKGSQRNWMRHAVRSGALVVSQGFDPLQYSKIWDRSILEKVTRLRMTPFRITELVNRVAVEYAASMLQGAPLPGSAQHRWMARHLNATVAFYFSTATMPGFFGSPAGRLLFFLGNTAFRTSTQTLRWTRETFNWANEAIRTGRSNVNEHAARSLLRSVAYAVGLEELFRLGRRTIGYQLATYLHDFPLIGKISPAVRAFLAGLQERDEVPDKPLLERLKSGEAITGFRPSNLVAGWRLPILLPESLPGEFMLGAAETGIRTIEGDENAWGEFWERMRPYVLGRAEVELYETLRGEKLPEKRPMTLKDLATGGPKDEVRLRRGGPDVIRTIPEARSRLWAPGLPAREPEARRALLESQSEEQVGERERASIRKDIEQGEMKGGAAARKLKEEYGVSLTPSAVRKLREKAGLSANVQRINAAGTRVDKVKAATAAWPHLTNQERLDLRRLILRWGMAESRVEYQAKKQLRAVMKKYPVRKP